jgi:hypothetical protein
MLFQNLQRNHFNKNRVLFADLLLSIISVSQIKWRKCRLNLRNLRSSHLISMPVMGN